ncbi:nuclear transport factor 2 family protein [Pseudomonas gessardii]|uniref:nuclear transport factor 2 family protein n=1 Tax=Pseudomonas gessardii TaxID=78544 RepID=UPI0018D973D4|nr:nuclear transport factor 2 family protein [Pseudomonas gessardii]MBH3426090.1 nuclear transport factor 2 family protein [Pseudomonas gessardii]
MKTTNLIRTQLLTLTMASAVTFFTAASAYAAQGDGTPPFSSDPKIKSVQQEAYKVVRQYEQALNEGNTQKIVSLFAPDSVAEWNNKPTYATVQQKTEGYDALFKIAKFNTVFAYDAINLYGDAAVIRTHHHKGATVMENGKPVPDLNREVFVLNKTSQGWKIVLYTFNTDPVQGEG